MIRIAITTAAFQAIAATLPLGSVAVVHSWRAGEIAMKLNPAIWLAAAASVILGIIVGGWNGGHYGRDGGLEYMRELG